MQTIGERTLYDKTKDMHKAFGSPVAEYPTLLSGAGEEVNKELAGKLHEVVSLMKKLSKEGQGGQVLARSSWIVEEVVEFMKAETLTDQVDAMGDADVFVNGTFVEMGVNPQPITGAIMAANMGKLWPDGKPRFDAQGKWIKPKNWEREFAPEPKINSILFWMKIDAKACPECGGTQKVSRREGGKRKAYCGHCLARENKLVDIGAVVKNDAVR